MVDDVTVVPCAIFFAVGDFLRARSMLGYEAISDRFYLSSGYAEGLKMKLPNVPARDAAHQEDERRDRRIGPKKIEDSLHCLVSIRR